MVWASWIQERRHAFAVWCALGASKYSECRLYNKIVRQMCVCVNGLKAAQSPRKSHCCFVYIPTQPCPLGWLTNSSKILAREMPVHPSPIETFFSLWIRYETAFYFLNLPLPLSISFSLHFMFLSLLLLAVSAQPCLYTKDLDFLTRQKQAWAPQNTFTPNMEVLLFPPMLQELTPGLMCRETCLLCISVWQPVMRRGMCCIVYNIQGVRSSFQCFQWEISWIVWCQS